GARTSERRWGRWLGGAPELRKRPTKLPPPILQQTGLPEAVRSYCAEFSAARGIPVACDADDHSRDLSSGAALALFRVLQEALGNAAKYAQATRIRVGLVKKDGDVSLTVSDDGVGF